MNLNLPGYANSGGPATAFSNHQAKCYYEAIEWAARQDWCTGKVGLSGVSYLAISQYHVAACQHYGGPPPSLRCISPWEGLTDLYRDTVCPGGLEDTGFSLLWWLLEVKPSLNGSPADFARLNGGLPMEMPKSHPLYDDFWRERTAKVEQIALPMLVCASFSDHGLHTEGSFRAFERAVSVHKWLYTHRGGKWDVYYAPDVQRLTKQFMDCFLKDDVANGFLERAAVRLEVRSARDTIHAVRDEREWPLARTRYEKVFLADGPPRLERRLPPGSAAVAHPARGGRSAFALRFERDTELTGYMKLRLWVKVRTTAGDATPPDDMAIFVAICKRDASGRPVPFRGSVGNTNDMVSRGFCRVSRRELDAGQSTEFRPVLSGTSHRPLAPGEVVPVDIALYPSSTFFAAGETLELVVASDEIIPSPPYRKDASFNRGTHVIHCGGAFDSHLLVPVIPQA